MDVQPKCMATAIGSMPLADAARALEVIFGAIPDAPVWPQLPKRSLREQKYDPQRSFNTWIWLKARSVWIDRCRRGSRQPLRLPTGTELADAQRGQSQVDERLDAERMLEQVANRLGAETYETFLLYYEGELTQDEVAAVVGRDPKTVRKRIRQAHELLQSLLKG